MTTAPKAASNTLPINSYLEALLLRKAITAFANEMATIKHDEDSLISPEEVNAAMDSLKTKISAVPYLQKKADAAPVARKPRDIPAAKPAHS